MSAAHVLARKRDPLHEPIAENARWWRLWLTGRNFAGRDYAVIVQIDDINNPQIATVIFNDGLGEVIAAEAYRSGVEEHRLMRRDPLRRLMPGDPYLDLLTVGPPTNSPLWHRSL